MNINDLSRQDFYSLIYGHKEIIKKFRKLGIRIFKEGSKRETQYKKRCLN